MGGGRGGVFGGVLSSGGGIKSLGFITLNPKPREQQVCLAATKHVGVAGYYKSGLEPPPEAAKLLYKASWM